MELPVKFKEHMKELLKDEYDDFEKALLEERSYGLRFNPLKVNLSNADEIERLSQKLGVTEKIPWADEGFYYDNEKRPGHSIYHEAGLIYIQEPSAMAVVTALDPKPGERICDLCAAPGGKTTHIAGRMLGRGLLAANEIMADRSRILAQNVERMGIRNCIVFNEDPETMRNRFPGYFNRIVVDAPCSGEGMFRKDQTAIEEWSPENVSMCAERQIGILENAAEMVMPGGTLVYSTCTFEPAEDEEVIGNFIRKHQDWHVVSTGLEELLSQGRPEWMTDPDPELAKAIRIWPHKNKGEGHFLCKLVRDGVYTNTLINTSIIEYGSLLTEKKIYELAENSIENTGHKNGDAGKDNKKRHRIVNDPNHDYSYKMRKPKDENTDKPIFIKPAEIEDSLLKNLKIIKPGLNICRLKKDRLEPAHSLAIALRDSEYDQVIYLNEDEAGRYLNGESISRNMSDYPENLSNGSFALVCFEGYSLGWGKFAGGVVKNHYPKGIRRRLY